MATSKHYRETRSMLGFLQSLVGITPPPPQSKVAQPGARFKNPEASAPAESGFGKRHKTKRRH